MDQVLNRAAVVITMVSVRALPDSPTEAFVMSTRCASTRRGRRTSVARGVGNATETERGSTSTPPGKTGETSTGRGGGLVRAVAPELLPRPLRKILGSARKLCYTAHMRTTSRSMRLALGAAAISPLPL